MNKDTLGGRFAEKFGGWFEGAEIDMGMPKSISAELKSFFKEELERLAVEIQSGNFTAPAAAFIIRSKINEL